MAKIVILILILLTSGCINLYVQLLFYSHIQGNSNIKQNKNLWKKKYNMIKVHRYVKYFVSSIITLIYYMFQNIIIFYCQLGKKVPSHKCLRIIYFLGYNNFKIKTYSRNLNNKRSDNKYINNPLLTVTRTLTCTSKGLLKLLL